MKPLLAALLLMGLSACSLLPEQIDVTAGWSANRFYTEAKEALLEGNYETAINHYEKLQARYPFGRYAQQAQLDLIYAYYRSGEPDMAIAAADRFIKSNPRHPFVDYAYYLKGVVNFNRGVGALERLLPGDPTKTDTATATRSFNDFAELTRRFPDSKYAEDARQRMVFLYNNLAGYELNVADFYYRRKAYLAAANRTKYLIETYPRSPAVTDALAIQVRAYAQLGLMELAQDTLRVLERNHPNHPQLASLSAAAAGQPEPTGIKSLFDISLFDFF